MILYIDKVGRVALQLDENRILSAPNLSSSYTKGCEKHVLVQDQDIAEIEKGFSNVQFYYWNQLMGYKMCNLIEPNALELIEALNQEGLIKSNPIPVDQLMSGF